MKIDEIDPDYETVKVDQIGILDSQTGAVLLKDGRVEFVMSGFSSEVAKIISDFANGKRDDPPTIYRLVEQICEENEIFLVKVKIYESGGIFRANLYFTGKKDMVFRNFRASDAIALATYYNIPILVRKSMLKNIEKN
ncbi:MAG: bifunctional nuclease family protein [Nitrosopumilus sp.]|nr:bifunctional nuclease family protein [Nitrosopumilus sp.]MDH3517000.1 bifunctional nuclease family protein [Nitrosopumilus sp.]MDH3565698.1 bifunctional nuclease family protein [Nitrosopumilus sp.]MDH5416556.1 bifunctional nuclease family protein [Nitrosopumilus sp.]MDH5555156.1 bifunctional nuclease family protein [Nitrosopumilus sp.]